MMNRHVSDGDHTETVQVASSSRDLTYWTVPSVFEGGQPEGEAGKEAEPSRSWTQFPWAAAGIHAVSAVWDTELEMYLAVYEGQETTGKLSGSIRPCSQQRSDPLAELFQGSAHLSRSWRNL